MARMISVTTRLGQKLTIDLSMRNRSADVVRTFGVNGGITAWTKCD